jgi:hypothetical protein
MTLRSLFDDHAAFYREHYVPFLQEEGFIDEPSDSEFGEGVDRAVKVAPASVESRALPVSLKDLLCEVGSCAVNYPTGQGPVPLYVMSPKDIAGWREPQLKSVGRYLEKAGPAAPATGDAWPFLTDAGGAIVAFVSASDGRVYLVNYEGKLRGPVASLEAFFALLFENAREKRMPFDGVAGADPATRRTVTFRDVDRWATRRVNSATGTQSLTPLQAHGVGSPATAVSAGGAYTGAIGKGTVQCWGASWAITHGRQRDAREPHAVSITAG